MYYIDGHLVEIFTKIFGEENNIELAIDNCGIWYTIDELRKETEDYKMTIAEAFFEYFYVIKNNQLLFCSPEEFINDCKEVFLEENE